MADDIVMSDIQSTAIGNGDGPSAHNVPRESTKPAVEAAPENKKPPQYAFIARHAKCDDGHRSVYLHSIVVSSEPLKKFLCRVLADHSGISTELTYPEFESPFKPFVQGWDALVKARREEQDATTKEHVDLLYKVLKKEHRDILARKKDLVRNGVITHDLLWTIFEPGKIMINTQEGRTRGFCFSHAEMDSDTNNLKVWGKFVDFNGSDFGYAIEEFNVGFFTGMIPIAELPVYPLQYHAENASIYEILLARGTMWERHKGCHYKHRIIIDAKAFRTFHPCKLIEYSELLPADLADHQRAVTSPMVHGYSLNDKEWLSFYLDCASEITWDSQPFNKLILPGDQEVAKELISAIAKSHLERMNNFNNVGRNRGVIMHLRGPAGVGKTLTAEWLAEEMHVPLYVMNAGDLGATAKAVEKDFKKILRTVFKWGAILLLDEAEVFLKTRKSKNLRRSDSASAFLRMLEYNKGILVLTTDERANVDPSFESRTQLTLHYDELNEAVRRCVWSQFARAANVDLTEQERNFLARPDQNGHQIKNQIESARVLALHDATKLEFKHIERVHEIWFGEWF